MRGLPPATERLWNLLASAEELSDFVLIGGTALSMQLQHRLSEDLDFIQSASGRLVRGHIRAARVRLHNAGWTMRENPSPALIDEFEDSGQDWADYQQDFIADDPQAGSVKLTFVVAEPENLRCLEIPANAKGHGPRVASVPELFRLKCIAAADRTKSRDWLDLYLLMRDGRFSHEDFIEAFEQAGVPQKRDIALSRMTSGTLPSTDEGFSALLASPPSLQEIRTFFVELADRVEQELAARQFASPKSDAQT